MIDLAIVRGLPLIAIGAFGAARGKSGQDLGHTANLACLRALEQRWVTPPLAPLNEPKLLDATTHFAIRDVAGIARMRL